MNNAVIEYNKVVSHMQQRYETSQYYRQVLKESKNDIKEAIKSLIVIFEDIINNDPATDKLYNNMILFNIRNLKQYI